MTVNLDPAFLTTPVAHRGLHDAAAGCYENTPSAFQAAIARGYAIELDVQLSLDGQAMVFHDETLDRLTNQSGPVNARTAAELRDIKVGPDGITPLGDILDLINAQVPVLIEIKDQSLTLTETDGRLERAVCDAVARYSGPVAIMSFNPHAMAHVQRLTPTVARGLTTCGFEPVFWPDVAPDRGRALADIPDFDAVGASFISHDVLTLSQPAVARIKAAGYPVLCWTVRSKSQEHDARRICDNVTFEGYLP